MYMNIHFIINMYSYFLLSLHLSISSLFLLSTASVSLVRMIVLNLTSASLRRANEPQTVSAGKGGGREGGETERERQRDRERESEGKHDNVNITIQSKHSPSGKHATMATNNKQLRQNE